MKRYSTITILIFIILAISTRIFGSDKSLRVNYIGKNTYDFINLLNLNNIYYFNSYELNKAFNAYLKEDFSDSRIYIELYGEQYIFLLYTPYFIKNNQIYNMNHSSIIHRNRVFLPVTFLIEVLPIIDFGNFIYDANNQQLSAQAPVDNRIRKIVIDPGHGGKDPGAVGASQRTYEKDIVLAVAVELKRIIEENSEIKVLLTRDRDVFMPLQERTQFANQNNADLFVSLHCNASPRQSARGIEVFFLSAARTDEARAVELLENSVVEIYEGKDALKQYDDLSFILMDMAQTEQLRESSYLAIKLQANLINRTQAHDRGVKQAGFFVLRGAFMPSVLVELGFLTNPQEEQRLRTISYQKKLAQALFEGLMEYVIRYETIP